LSLPKGVGSRMRRDWLAFEGIVVGRLHVATLMKRRVIAIYRKPDTSKPAPGNRLDSYLPRNLHLSPSQIKYQLTSILSMG
jgi:putative transposase